MALFQSLQEVLKQVDLATFLVVIGIVFQETAHRDVDIFVTVFDLVSQLSEREIRLLDGISSREERNLTTLEGLETVDVEVTAVNISQPNKLRTEF